MTSKNKKTIQLKYLNRHFFKENIQMSKKNHPKRCSTSIVIREIQVKTMRYHFISSKMAIINKVECNKCWQWCEEIETLVYCLWKYNIVQELCKTDWWFLKKLNIKLPCCCSVTLSCSTLCNPMDCSMPGLPIHHYLPEFAQVRVYCISDAIQPSHPLIPCSPSASVFPSIRDFSSESTVCIRWPKYCNFSFRISPSNEYSGLISFKMTALIFLSKGLSEVFSSTTVWRHQFFGVVSSLQSSSYNHTWPLERPKPWLYGPLSAE